jgi:hypothetical protein
LIGAFFIGLAKRFGMAGSNDLDLTVRGRRAVADIALDGYSTGPRFSLCSQPAAPAPPRRQQHPPQSTAGSHIATQKADSLVISKGCCTDRQQTFEITCFSDRHFWHEDYDKA